MSDTVGKSPSEFQKLKLEDIYKIRNDYNLEYLFNKDKNYLQFLLILKMKNNVFYTSPIRKKWETTIMSFINDNILKYISNFNNSN